MMLTMNGPHADEPTSPTLLNDARARDPEAWRRLVHLYSPAVFRWAKRTGLGDEDAGDIVQDVWAAVSGALDRFRKERTTDTFRGWLWTVTRNKVRDLARRRDESAVAGGGTDAQRALNSVPEAEPPEEADSDSADWVRRALDLVRTDFEDTTWRAFWGMVVEGKSARDVGEAVGLAPNAVHQAKFRVVKRLRQALEELGVADDPSFVGTFPGA